MNRKQLLSLYGLKWNPFASDLPTEALHLTPQVEHFCWRVEQLVKDGGFALISGEPGSGKSVALRLVCERLSRLREVAVGVLVRPQSHVADFYRELGELFSVPLSPHNRWCGYKALREKWKSHVETHLLRPVLLIDEAQEMAPAVLSELRLLSSAHFDSTCLLTIVLAGDGRLLEKLRQQELLPLGSRIRARLALEPASREQLVALVRHALEQAGNASLMTPELIDTLVEHCAGNYRVLMTMAGELLAAGLAAQLERLDEKLFLQVFSPPSTRRRGETAAAAKIKSR